MELIHVSGNTDCLLGKTAVGIYRIDDTRCILFDNGYSKEYDELIGSLKDAGLTPAGLIVSHAHIDHHGNSKRLREAFQIPLAMSLGEAGLIASQAALERYTNYFGRSEEEKVSIDTEQRCPVDIRRMSLSACHVVNEKMAKEREQKETFEQLDLFTDYAKKEAKEKEEQKKRERERRMQEALLTIKKKYGKNAVLRGMNFEEGATAKERTGQIGGHQA